MQLQNPAHRNFQIVWMETQDFYCFRQLQQPSTRFGSRIGKTWRAWHRVGIKGSWLVNNDSISWYQEAKISKVSIFHESLRYDNFKIISPGDRYLPVYVKLLTLINEKKKIKNRRILPLVLSTSLCTNMKNSKNMYRFSERKCSFKLPNL